MKIRPYFSVLWFRSFVSSAFRTELLRGNPLGLTPMILELVPQMTGSQVAEAFLAGKNLTEKQRLPYMAEYLN